MHLLLIEDDLDLGRALQAALKLEGFSCEWLRRVADAPAVVDHAWVDCVLLDFSLPGGADDFLVKPFAPAELISRIRAVLRRYARQASEVWTVGPLTLEPRAHVARLEGQPLELTPREFKLLLELAREPGAVVPKGFLAQRLEPLGEAIDFNALEVHVFNLRRKLGPERIHTVRGVGYLLKA